MNVPEFLTARQVAHDVIPHRNIYGAQRLAQELHVSGNDVAKTVLLRADGGYRYLVAILPASMSIDLSKVSDLLGHCKIELASETEIAEHCPDCEFGVLPPFGSQYGMKTLVDESLAAADTIVFEGNSHHEAIRMRYADFHRLEQPLTIQFAMPAELAGHSLD